jgi:hypothetical protein
MVEADKDSTKHIASSHFNSSIDFFSVILKQYTHYRALQVVATTFDCTTYVQ